MKNNKLFPMLLCVFLMIFLPQPHLNAYTVFVGMDNTLSLEKIDTFQFDIVEVNLLDSLSLTIFGTSETITINGEQYQGALPELSGLANIYWAIDKSTNGFYAMDNYIDNAQKPLAPGVILSLSSDSVFSLDNFTLGSSWYQDGKYPPPWTVLKSPISTVDDTPTNGLLYVYSAVPIPATALLFLSGIFGLVGIRRFKGRKLEGQKAWD